MTCKCEHWQVCDECRQGRFPKTEDKDMTKLEILEWLRKLADAAIYALQDGEPHYLERLGKELDQEIREEQGK